MEKINWNDWFYYDETSPSCLRWKVSRTNTKHHNNFIAISGDAAGSIGTDGYWYNCVKRIKRPAHIIVWEMFKGKVPEGFLVDHRDGNSLNNFITNLRVIELIKNARNCKMNSRNSSGVTGVTFQENWIKELYVRASWCNLTNGAKVTKSFSVKKLGIMVAFRDAVIHRQKMIEELNSQGAGYTDRHGKENK